MGRPDQYYILERSSDDCLPFHIRKALESDSNEAFKESFKHYTRQAVRVVRQEYTDQKHLFLGMFSSFSNFDNFVNHFQILLFCLPTYFYSLTLLF